MVSVQHGICFEDGRKEIRIFEADNRLAYVPVWGEKFIWDGSKAGNKVIPVVERNINSKSDVARLFFMKNYFKKCCLLSLVLWGFAFAGVADVAGKDDDVESVKAMLKLCGHKKITVKLIASQEINEGDLEHVDILVLKVDAVKLNNNTGLTAELLLKNL